MKRVLLYLLAIVFLAGCGEKPLERNTPQSAFGRFGKCLETVSYSCMMNELDRDSRWSLHSIYKTLAQTKQIVDNSYPEDKRDGNLIYGVWKEEAKSTHVHEMFKIFCEEQNCLRTLAKGFGAVTDVEKVGAGTVRITTTRGVSFVMVEIEGEWGLGTYRELLQKEKLRLADSLAQVKRNAADFAEQQKATGTN